MVVSERIAALRRQMQEKQIDVYLVPTADFHESEYVGDYFKVRAFLTGFTGSAGVAVITMNEAGLWTDGRYFIQAERQLSGSGITLYRSGLEGVPTELEFIEEKLPKGGCLGFDGRVVNAAFGEMLEGLAVKKEGRIASQWDLADAVWKDRPAFSQAPGFLLREEYSGQSAGEKLARIRKAMALAGAKAHLVASLDDVCWICNIRGNDAGRFHVILSYLLITMEMAVLFVNRKSLNKEIEAYLFQNGIEIRPYDQVYEDAEVLPEESVLIQKDKINYRLYGCLKHCSIISQMNPSILLKAAKNEVELANLKKAHVKDGVAMVKFLYWLKKNVGKGNLTELSASDYLEQCRYAQGAIDLSFDTICAYGSNAAMMHYSASLESNAVLEPKGFLLVDSGGHYMEGSTDITRTIALGELTREEKLHFTAVLRSNLNLAHAKFLHGCTGQNLDILARGPIWDLGLDYRCGTGHGVGYLLSIHEPPNGFRYKKVPERLDSAVLEPGMVTTDEPGIYLEGQYGIRTENELVCREAEQNEYGQFLEFETITYCPIDLEAVEVSCLSKTDVERLNQYHRMVYETLVPHLTEEEAKWLQEATRNITYQEMH